MLLFANCGILDRPPVLGIPGLIGCGLAGGSWHKVYEEILVPLFAEGPQDLYIYYFTEKIYKKNHKGEKTLPAKDKTDRMSNAIHVYSEAGAKKIKELQEKLS